MRTRVFMTRNRMTRTHLLVLLALAALWLGVFAPVALAQDKSVVWERFDVDIDVNADGTFDVTENQDIRFTSGEFTFGTRYIPKRNFSYIDNWSLTDSQGNVYQQTSGGDNPYTFTVQDNSGQYDIRWNFPPIRNDSETYLLSYTVHDGLRFYEGGDQVWWKAIYGDRSFPVLAGTVRVRVPGAAAVQEWAAYINGADARDSATAQVAGDDEVVFDLTQRLNAGQEFEVRVEFTPGIVDGAAQPWQQSADAAAAEAEAAAAFRNRWQDVATLGLCLLGLLLGGGGLVGLYLIWYKFGRDKPVEMVADYLPEPPDTLPPGMAGTLLDERADMEDILATVVDLARRKAISITQEEESGWLRTSRDFIYRRERNDVPLLPYEEALLDAMFGSKDEVRLSDLKEKFYTKLDGLKTGLYEAVVQAGHFPRSPESVRTQYGCLGIAGIVTGVLLAVGGGIVFGSLTPAGIFPGIGLGIASVGVLVLARYMPRKTNKGAQDAARWNAFRTYLKDIDKYSDVEAQKTIWDRWLPYAIAFGVDKEYIRQFEAVNAPAPGWYIPGPAMYGPYHDWYYGTPGTPSTTTAGGGSGGGGLASPIPSGDGQGMGGGLSNMSQGMGTSLAAMSVGLGAMLNNASSTFTSRPASSSSGGGWNSGGGGFSGGGSFGGGGGGGGGGGFG